MSTYLLSERGYGTLGDSLSERGYGSLGTNGMPDAQWNKFKADMAAAEKASAAAKPKEKSKWDKILDFGKGAMDNYYRGKISAEQMQAQQLQMQMMMQRQQSPIMQYLPYIAIGGVALIAIVMLKK